jgi:hypothetical protein
MSMQTLTAELPNALYQRLVRLAATTNQPLDAVLLQTIRGNLPPSVDDIPADYRDDLSKLIKLSDDDLLAVARAAVDPRKWRRHESLLQKNAENTLTEDERDELEQLRAGMDALVYRKSFALAVLKWRGYSLSTLIPEANSVTP